MALKTQPRLSLHSSDRDIETGFELLKDEALRWVFEGYPVGDYYEAALPGRDAFCMRDVSHQCMGAQALGLGRHNHNMLKKFASGISEERDFCSFWEIDRWDRPCPVDYRDDSDFWYNLPANFDVMDAIYRMWRWSGDGRYLNDGEFQRFCALTAEQYVARWDRDGDGLPDRVPQEGRRGIASYDEGDTSVHRLKVGSDLVLIMARGYISYSELCRVRGLKEYARIYRRRGESLLKDIRQRWLDPARGLAFGMDLDGGMVFPGRDPWREKELIYRGVATSEEAAPILDMLEADPGRDQILELFSHIPESLWRYGREDAALRAMRIAMDKTLPRREYPEASFAAIGALVAGMMGVDPDAERGAVKTQSGLGGLEWVTMNHISVLDGHITVEHEGHEKTCLISECPRPIIWRAQFAGDRKIFIGGSPAKVESCVDPRSGRKICWAETAVAPGEAVCAAAE